LNGPTKEDAVSRNILPGGPGRGGKNMMSVLRATLALALVVVGAFGTVGAAFAQTVPIPSEQPHRGLVGTVKGGPAAAASSFVLTLKRKGGDPIGDVTINVVPATKFKIPGDKSVNSTNYNFADGDRVAVLGELVTGTTYKALHVHLIPATGHASYSHRVGTITGPYDFDGAVGNVTIQPKTGGPVPYSWVAAPKITFKKGAIEPYSDGERATVILKRNPDTGVFDVKQIVVSHAKGKP